MDKNEKRKQRQKEFIRRKKWAREHPYIMPEVPECCMDCLDKSFNVDDSVDCLLTDETIYEPFDHVGERCPKKGEQKNE